MSLYRDGGNNARTAKARDAMIMVNMNSEITIAVGLSGGVDSALAAAILKDEGYKVIGLTMKIWRGAYKIQEGLKHACFGPGEEEDIAACERLSAQLGIDYKVIDLSEEYEKHVIEYFRKEYLEGRTPNPCVICNRELKFGFLIDRAHDAGLEFDFFATGHYARKEVLDGISFVRTAVDSAKDQTYFLYGLDSSRLKTILFPLGSMTKSEVRSLAREHGLEVAEKPESQDFVAGGDYAPLFENAEPLPGDIVDTAGKVLGKHRGLPFYTIGQRRGIGLSTGPSPLYVLGLDAKANRVIVGPNSGLFSSGLTSSNFVFQDIRITAGVHPEIDEMHGPASIRGLAKIRQNHKPVPCTVSTTEKGVHVEFDIAQRAVAPGQSIVLYSDEGLVLGGGIIDAAIQAE